MLYTDIFSYNWAIGTAIGEFECYMYKAQFPDFFPDFVFFFASMEARSATSFGVFAKSNEPSREKTSILGFRPGTIQTGLYSRISMLEACHFVYKKKRHCTIYVANTKGADQLCSYCTADLRLCFRSCMLLVFLRSGSNTCKIHNILLFIKIQLSCYLINYHKETSLAISQTSFAIHKKVQVGKDQEKAQSEKDSHSKNRGGKKTN